LKFKLKYKPFGDAALLIEWPQKISEDILNDIQLFVSKIENINHKEILELNYVYNSLLVIYNNKNTQFTPLKIHLQNLYKKSFPTIQKVENVLWKIPVCYDREFGIDLPILSQEKNISIDEIISMHSGTIYTIYGIGFLPGFLYLGGLPESLHFPRKETPRLNVPKGAVGIGGNQTGIYPKNSPGGWQIIGKTPISLFNVNNEMPCEFKASDKISFKPISRDEFNSIELAEVNGNYKLNKSFIND